MNTNYIGAIGDSFAHKYYSENIETRERNKAYELAQNPKYKTKAEFTIYSNAPVYANNKESKKMYDSVNSYFSKGGQTVYGFDIETFGDPFHKKTDSHEFLSSAISEFTVLRGTIKSNTNGSFDLGNIVTEANYTFGVNDTQAASLQEIIDKVHTKKSLSKTEMSSFQNLLRYGGVNLSQHKASSNEFFEYKNNLWSIKKHAPITNEFDTVQATKGLENMRIIGRNQHLGTEKGKKMLDYLQRDFKRYASSKAPVVSYNGLKFDIPFANEIFKRFGVDKIFEGVNHFDMYSVLQTSGQYTMLNDILEASLKTGSIAPTSNLGTLISQAQARGINIASTAHQALVDTATTLKLLFSGEHSLFNVINKNMVNVKSQDIQTFNPNIALYSNKAVRISSVDSDYNEIRHGILDQYMEDGVVKHNFSYSTNRGQYYKIDDYGFIPKNELGEDILKRMNKDAEGLYFMKLNNMADGVNRQSLLFRETQDEFEQLIRSNFTSYHYFPDNTNLVPNNDLDMVTQYEINQKTLYNELDNARRKEERINNPKDYANIKRVEKDVAMYNYINTKYKKAMFNKYPNSYLPEGEELNSQSYKYVPDLDIDTVKGILSNKPFKLSEIDSSLKDLSLDNMRATLDDIDITDKDVQSFISRYKRIGDEFDLNKKVLSNIGGILNKERLGLGDSAREANILSTLQTDAYNYIIEDLKKKYVESNMNDARLDGYYEKIKESILENEFIGYKNTPIENINVNSIDVLKDSRLNLINKHDVESLNQIDSNSKYTRIESGNNIDDIAKKIKSLSYGASSNKNLTASDRIAHQKEYLKDLVFDFEKRGVLEKGYSKKITQSGVEDISAITNQIAFDLNRVLEIAKEQFNKQELKQLNLINSNNPKVPGVAHSYSGLTRMNVKTINPNGHRINNASISNVVENMVGNTDNYVENLARQYYKKAPKVFDVRDSRNFSENQVLQQWFKNLGYTDKNIETLKDALFSTGKSGNKAIADKSSNLAFHFYTKEVNGLNIPFMAIADREANVISSLMRGEHVDNAANIMLPFVFNANANGIDNSSVDPNSNNRFVQIGGVTKSIANKQNIYMSNDIPVLREYDTVDDILNMFKLKKSEIKELMTNKEYSKLEKRLNKFSQRIQLDEIGVSQKISAYSPDGTVKQMFIPRQSDLDLLNKNVADELTNYIPFLYKYHKEHPDRNPIISEFVENMIKKFEDNYEPGYLQNMMDRAETKALKKNYSFSDMTPDMQEYARLQAFKKNGLLEAIREYAGNVAKDQRGHDIVDRLINKGHAITKDSHGTRLIIDEGRSSFGNPMGHLSGIMRMQQTRGAIPFIYDEFSYEGRKNVISQALGIEGDLGSSMSKYGVTFSPTITTSELINYTDEMRRSGFNIVTGITGNLKQDNPTETLKELNKIASNKGYAIKKLEQINTTLGTGFSIEDFEEVFKVFTSNYATFEQGGMLNPRFGFLYDKPQIFTANVGEDFFYNTQNALLQSNEPVTLNKGTSLGYIGNSNKQKIFKGQNGIIIDVEEAIGTTGSDSKYKVKYIHQNRNTNGIVKLFSAYGEKGIFNIPNVRNELNPLLYGLYDDFFGEDTFAVSSYEVFRHQGYGGIAGSYLNVMFDEYKKNPVALNNFTNRLNDLLPQYGFEAVDDSLLGIKMLKYNSSPIKIDNDKTMYNALTTIINELSQSNDDIDKSVYSKIKSMEKKGILRTEFTTAPLEEGMGRSVKFERRFNHMLSSRSDMSLYDIFGDEANLVMKEINKSLKTELLTSPSYQSNELILQNMKSTLDALKGNQAGVIKDININDIYLPSNMATYDELLESIIFDFNQSNQHGARVNTFSIAIPGGFEIENPFKEGEKINKLYIPLTKPYEVDSYMLSNMQKNISSVILDAKKMQFSYDEGDTSAFLKTGAKLEKEYKTLIASFYGELVDKDGLLNKGLNTTRIEKGGFGVVSKIVEPLLDENGGLLDPAGKNFWSEVNGNKIFYDNVDLSEGLLNELGVYVDDVGEQLYQNAHSHKSFFNKMGSTEFSNIETAKKNIQLAQEILKKPKNDGEALAAQNVLDINTKNLKDSYYKIGYKYLTEEGIYGITERYPIVKQDSVLVAKAFLNNSNNGIDSPDGKTFIAPSWFTVKTKLDTDADAMAFLLNGLFDKETGKLRIEAEDSYLNKIFEKIHFAQATGYSYDGETILGNAGIVKLQDDKRRSELGQDVITGGENSFLEEFKKYLGRTLSENSSIIDTDNVFADNLSVDLAYRTISSKTSIGYISNDNFLLRELAEMKYTGKENAEKLSLIQNVTGRLEQGIFDVKHITEEEYRLILNKPYRIAIDNILQGGVESTDKGISGLIDVVTSTGMFKNEDLNIDNILNNSPTTHAEKTIVAIKDLLQDDRIQGIKNDPLFRRQGYSQYEEIKNLEKIFYKGSSVDNIENTTLGKNYELFNELDDYQHLNIGDNIIGRNSFISVNNSEYKISDLSKLHLEDKMVDMLELENEYGEKYHILGKTFDDISKELNSYGATLIDKPYGFGSDMNVLEKMFSSQDDFIREGTYATMLGTLPVKNINDNQRIKKGLKKASDKFKLTPEHKTRIMRGFENSKDEMMIEKYRAFYDNIYGHNQDVFNSTYDMIRTLNETNIYNKDEVMIFARDYYTNVAAELQNEMNQSIRMKAINKMQMDYYKEIIPDHVYTDFDKYISEYTQKGKNAFANFNNTTSSKRIDAYDFFNVGLNEKYNVSTLDDLLNMGNSTININNTDLRINQATIAQLIDFVSTKNSNLNDITEAQERVKYYLIGAYNVNKQFGDSISRDGSQIDYNASNSGSMNDAIRESAEKLSNQEKLSNNALGNVMEYASKHKFVTASIIIGAIGAVSAITNIQGKQPLQIDNKPNGEQSSSDGVYDKPRKKERIAPRTEKKSYLANNSNISYDISAKNRNSSVNGNTIDKLKNLFKTNTHMSVSQYSDRSSISDEWIKDKIDGLL